MDNNWLLKCLLLLLLSHVALAEIEFTAVEVQWMEENPVVRTAGEYDWAPFDFVNSNNQYTGITKDYLDLITFKTGLNFTVEINDWHVNLAAAKTGEIDLLPALYRTKERESYLLFSHSYLSIMDFFFIRADLQLNDISELNGKTLAIPKDYAQQTMLAEKFPDLKQLQTNSLTESIAMVLDGRADVLYDNYSTLSFTLQQSNIADIVPFRSLDFGPLTQIHMAVPEHAAPLQGIINKALSSISQSEHNQILSKWLNNPELMSQGLGFNQQEQQWIKNNPEVRLGVHSQWFPIEFIDEKGEYQGMTAAYIKLIEKFSGLKITTEAGAWKDVLSQVKNNQLHGLSAAIKTADRLEFLDFTEPYSAMSKAVYTRSDVTDIDSLDDLSGKTVVVNKKSYTNKWLTTAFSEVKLVFSVSEQAAIQMVADGLADAYLGDLLVAEHVIQRSDVDNIKMVLSLQKNSTAVSFAINKNHPELLSIIQKSLAAIPEYEHQKIKELWAYQDENLLDLSARERVYIGNKSEYVFMSGQSMMPVEGYGPSGEYLGINADFLSAVEALLEQPFQHTSQTSRARVDVLFDQYPRQSFSEAFQAMRPHIKTPVVMLMRSSQKFIKDMDQIKKLRFVTLQGFNFVTELKAVYPDINLELVTEVQTAYEHISEEKADVLLLPFIHAQYQVQRQQAVDLHIVGKSRFDNSYSFYVNKASPELISVMIKVMNYISANKTSDIMQKWLAIDVADRYDYRWLITGVTALLVFSILVIYWNRKLRKEILFRKQAEIELENQKENFEVMFKHSAEANSIYQNGKTIDVNEAVLEMYGVESINEFLVSSFDEWLPQEQGPGINSVDFISEKVHQTLVSGGQRFELLAMRKNGETFWADVTFSRILYNKRTAIYSVWRDISEQKSMQSHLRRARIEADQANEAKSEFLANMSHEIRTPMNAIIGFTELLEEQVKDGHLKSYVRTIRSAGDTLLMLINDILDLSKIEAGKIESQQMHFNPNEYFEDIGQIFMINMQKKGLQLILDLNANLPDVLCMDINHLRQVIFNLMGNAIKFSERGKIYLRVSVYQFKKETVGLKVEVEDEGIGIPLDQQELIFAAFEQQKNQNRNRYSGTGLGLAISKKLVEHMGGEIAVKSEVGQGACFVVKIPDVSLAESADLQVVEVGKKINAKDFQFHQATLLIVDDTYHNRALIAEHFADSKVTTLHAENGLDAVNCVERHPVDLVLMDIRMPIMDGYTAAKRIKVLKPDLPIIALTASVLKEDHDKIEAGAFNGFLPKPVIKAKLFQTVGEFLTFDLVPETIELKEQVETFNAEQIKQLPEFIKQLDGPITAAWELASNTQNMKDINVLVNKLLVAADGIKEQGLKQYAENLKQDVDVFNIYGIEHLLKQFEQQKERIKKLAQEVIARNEQQPL